LTPKRGIRLAVSRRRNQRLDHHFITVTVALKGRDKVEKELAAGQSSGRNVGGWRATGGRHERKSRSMHS